MLDLNTPLHLTLVTIGSTFMISAGILYLVKPSWLQKLNSKGDMELSAILLCSYSLTFALVCGLTALILSTKQRGIIKERAHAFPTSAFPTQEDMDAFAQFNAE